MILLASLCLACALIPAAMFVWNQLLYRVPPWPSADTKLPPVSVLIPARNEEANIVAALDSVRANTGIHFEIIVLDDHSTDRTAELVREVMVKDSRVRLETAPPLPQGWCGKQHSCAALAGRASFPLLVFMDADVRLAPDALARMAAFVVEHDVVLASGVPRQVLGTFWEKTLLPLIHFVLLGFLPVARMRRGTEPAYAAGCGQLFIARAADYHAIGGHAAIRASLHDGVQLPRAFRRHGRRTDLFDATPLAVCRMYQSGAEVFAGLGKNAVEGLAAPARIVPFTLLLGLGQVLPFVLLAWPGVPMVARILFGGAAVLAWLPRVLAVSKFQQSRLGVFTHPLGVAALLLIQWRALLQHWRGRPAQWRGRSYAKATALIFFAALSFAGAGQGTNQPARIPEFSLPDQNGVTQRFTLPRTNLSLIFVADKKGSEQLDAWIQPAHDEHGKTVTIFGVADLRRAPALLRPFIRRSFVKEVSYPVLLDWTGMVVTNFHPVPDVANVYLLQTNGTVVTNWAGAVTQQHLAELTRLIRANQSRPVEK